VEQHFTFPKEVRLNHRRDIEALIKGGKAFNAYPLRVVSRPVARDPKAPVKLVISVPKRLFKRAVQRNLLKRRIREAFRLNRTELTGSLENLQRSIHVLVVFTGKETASFDLIQNKIILILQRLKGIHAQDSLNSDGRPADLL
jgi:ribonuclease P protein component